MAESQNHWLQDVAAHAGMQLDLPRRPDIAAVREAWPEVARACKLADDRFTQRVASHFRIGVADVNTYDPQAVKLIPEAVARRYGVLPLSATGNSIVIATSDPANRSAHKEIVAHASRQPVFLMSSPTILSEALERAYAPARAPKNALQTLVARVAETDFTVVTNEGRGLFTSLELEDPAVIKLADVVLHQGIRYRATEVHIEPGAAQGAERRAGAKDAFFESVLPYQALTVPDSNAIALEHDDFLHARAQGVEPRVSASAGSAALEIATRVLDVLRCTKLGVPPAVLEIRKSA